MKALRLDFCRAFVFLNPPLSSFSSALGRLLFIGVWGWVSDTWRSPIGDTCHNLIDPPVSSLTHTRSPVSLLTRVGLLVSLLTRAEVLVSLLTRARLLVSLLTRARLLVSSLTRAEV